MQLGMIGLGRMGHGMTERLREGGHEVCTYDPKVEERTATSLEELKGQLEAPRAFWLMIPAGKVTEDVFHDLLGLAEPGDTIVDDTGEELPIPGQPFGFGRLIRAQAAGDYAALKERGRRVARVRLEDL